MSIDEIDIKDRIAAKVKKLYGQNKKKYVCEFCGTGFDKRDFLISHMKIRHPEEYDLKYGESNFAMINPTELDDGNSMNGGASNTIMNPSMGRSAIAASSSGMGEIGLGGNQTLFPPNIGDFVENMTADFEDNVDYTQLEHKVDILNTSLDKTMKVLQGNMEMMMKEIRYLIAEYKSPFIIFD